MNTKALVEDILNYNGYCNYKQRIKTINTGEDTNGRRLEIEEDLVSSWQYEKVS